MNPKKKDLKRLSTIEKELSTLGSIGALLDWDKVTLMPKAALPQRAEHLTYISLKAHAIATSKELYNIVKRLHDSIDALTPLQQKIVKTYREDLERIRKIPSKHVEQFSKLTAKAYHAWEEARAKKKYSIFKPYLEKIFAMRRTEAELIDHKKNPYDVLIYDYDKSITTKHLDTIFSPFKKRLDDIYHSIINSPAYNQERKKKTNHLPQLTTEGQKHIAEHVSKLILNAPERTVLATSTHPFSTTISDDDARITTNYRESDPLFSYTSTLHESGHSLYELSINHSLRNTILHHGTSLSIHESQSRIWENHVGKHPSFIKYIYPHMKRHQPALQKLPISAFNKILHTVQPSLIRIESDELTYHYHILIRYQLERALLDEKITAKEASTVWNEAYKEKLGITPRNDREGILQDVHWSQGSICYFPTYTLGTMIAAQLWNTITKQHPEIPRQLANGNVATIRTWLGNNIHKYGARKTTHELLHHACKKELNSDDLIKHYKEHYEKRYTS